MCREEKNISIYVITRLQNSCKQHFKKNTEAATGGAEAVIKRCSARKGVLKNFVNFTGKHLCWSLF